MNTIPLEDGVPHAQSILKHITALCHEWAIDSNIRAAAEEITAATAPTQDRERAHLLKVWVVDHMIYRPDPTGTERVKNPIESLAEIATSGRAFGDCDDFVALFVSLARSIGLECRPVGVRAGTDASDPERFDHVIAVCEFHDYDGLVQIDLCEGIYPGRKYPVLLMSS